MPQACISEAVAKCARCNGDNGKADRDGDVRGDPAVINRDTICCCCLIVRDGEPGGDIATSVKAMSLLE